MLGMGLSLVPADFKRVLQQPKAAAVGIFCQMVLLPLLGLGVIMLVKMDNPALAVGLMVLTFCPGGTTSNLFSFLAKGDVALSISLTAVVSLLSPFTIPFLTKLSIAQLMSTERVIEVPVLKTIVALLAITVVPVAIGMGIRAKWKAVALKAERPVRIFSAVFLFAIVAGLLKQNAAQLPKFFAQAGISTLLLNLLAMAVGFGAAVLAKLEHKQRVTISLEVGIQNGTTALLVTGTLLNEPAMTIPAAIYSLFMFATGGLFGVLINRVKA